MKKIIFLFIIVTTAFTTQSFCQNTTPTLNLKNGQTIYESYCMSCHMEDGKGIDGVFPSLVQTGNLNDKNRLVKIILQGIRGKIVVKGTNYDAEMAGISLSDQEVSDVINYIRNSWGNKAPLMKSNEVEVAKKAVVKGYQPY